MTLSQLMEQTLLELGETDASSPVTYSFQEARDALNEAQRLYVLLSLCLTAEATLSTVSGEGTAYVSSQISNFLCPLWLRAPGGLRIRPAQLGQLEAANAAWRTVTGEPTRYAMLGWDLIVYNYVPDAVYAMKMVYAKCPSTMTALTDEPEIPVEDHHVLIDAALPIMRLKEGGSQLSKLLPRFQVFLAAASARATYVRARSRDNQYDSMPPEWKVPDLSRLLKKELK
jgi:hypothetical protein